MQDKSQRRPTDLELQLRSPDGVGPRITSPATQMVGSSSVPNLKRTEQRKQRPVMGHVSAKAMRLLMPGVSKSKDERETQLGWREREELEERE